MDTLQTWIVNTAKGDTVEVEATRVVQDEGGYLAQFYNGDNLVASFRSYSGLYPKPANVPEPPVAP